MEHALLVLALIGTMVATAALVFELNRPKSSYDMMPLFTVPLIVGSSMYAITMWALYAFTT